MDSFSKREDALTKELEVHHNGDNTKRWRKIMNKNNTESYKVRPNGSGLSRLKRHRYRWIAGILLVLMLVMAVVGCAASKKEQTSNAVPPASFDDGYSGERFDDMYAREPGDAMLNNDQPKKNEHGDFERKYIEQGTLSLRSADIDKTYKALSDLASSLGGRIISYQKSVSEDLAYSVITMKVAVPFGKLNAFMEHAGQSATKIETQAVTSEEVTESYYDTKVRIESIEKQIEHYRKLLEKAETIEDTMRVQMQIDYLTTDLESFKGHLKLLDYLTKESQIDITIRMDSDPTVTKPDVTLTTMKWSDVGYLMKNALKKVGIGIALGFQYFLIFLVYAAPVVILILLIILIVFLVRRRKRKKRAIKPGKATSQTPAYVAEALSPKENASSVSSDNSSEEKK